MSGRERGPGDPGARAKRDSQHLKQFGSRRRLHGPRLRNSLVQDRLREKQTPWTCFHTPICGKVSATSVVGYMESMGSSLSSTCSYAPKPLKLLRDTRP